MLVHAIGQKGVPLDANALIEDIKRMRPDWSKSEIARRIGTSHTTIGRKSQLEHRGARVDTLNALIKLRDELIAEDLATGLHEPEVDELAGEDAPAGLRPAADQIVIRINNRALDQAGILPGDWVLFHLDRDPGDGDIVLASLFDDDRAAERSICRRFYAPNYLTVATSDPTMSQKPLRAGHDPVVIRGVKLRLLREGST